MEDLLNGGETDGYRWGQTLEEVTVHIDVGPGVRAKELVVDIKRTSVRVAKKAEPDAAPLRGATLIAVGGSDFVPSPGLRCVFTSADGDAGEYRGLPRDDCT